MPPLNLYARGRFLCATCSRDRGCSVHPVFPAPSDWRSEGLSDKARAHRAARPRSRACCCLIFESETAEEDAFPGCCAALLRCAADPGSTTTPGPHGSRLSAVHREERCTASGTTLHPVNQPVTSFVYPLPTIRLSSNGPIGEQVCRMVRLKILASAVPLGACGGVRARRAVAGAAPLHHDRRGLD